MQHFSSKYYIYKQIVDSEINMKLQYPLTLEILGAESNNCNVCKKKDTHLLQSQTSEEIANIKFRC